MTKSSQSPKPFRTGVLFRVLRIASVASLVLVVLLSAAWFRSTGVRDWIDLYRGGYVTSESGHVAFWSNGRLPTGLRKASADVVIPGKFIDAELQRTSRPGFWRDQGFGFHNFGFTETYLPSAGGMMPPPKVVPVFLVVVPYWPPIALLSLVGVATWRGSGWRLRVLRRRAGLCLACGYDLRESPERCPECGEAKPSLLVRLLMLIRTPVDAARLPSAAPSNG